MFNKIVFATSATRASDHAARVAFNLAARYDAELNLFHVLGVPSRGYSQVVMDVKTREKVEVTPEYMEWIEEEIRTYYADQMKPDMKCGIKAVVGVPHREILRHARDTGADLIVLGGTTSEESEAVYRQSVPGSTLQRVARGARCPVLVVSRPAASFWGGMSSIVLGTDFSKASDSAFDFAVSIARQLGCELSLFHCLDISGKQMGRSMSQDEIEQKIREALRRMRSRYVPRMDGIPRYAMDVWEGIPYVEVVKYAREKHADLVVMAHHSRRRDSGSDHIGSNMEQVIVRSSCPVISVNR